MKRDGCWRPRGSSSVRMLPVGTMTPCCASGLTADAPAVALGGGTVLDASLEEARGVLELVARGEALAILTGCSGDGRRAATATTRTRTPMTVAASHPTPIRGPRRAPGPPITPTVLGAAKLRPARPPSLDLRFAACAVARAGRATSEVAPVLR